MDIYSPLTAIKGVGEKTAEAFAKLQVHSVADLLLNMPRDYIRYPRITELNQADHLDTDAVYALRVRISSAPVVRRTSRMQITMLTAGDIGHRIQLVWYRMPYLKNTLIPGQTRIFYGKITIKNQKYTMEQPAVYQPEEYEAITDTLQPVYSLTSGVTNSLVTRTVTKALADDTLFTDYLPAELRSRYGLCELNYAIKQMHFPDNMESLITARRRMVFGEFFLFILGMQYQKEQKLKDPNLFDFQDPAFLDRMIAKLPFQLTNAQLRAIREISADMQGEVVMERLIQGDVGSGKTIIAYLLMAWTASNGYQSAIMAPTEVLARQHYDTFLRYNEQFGLSIPVVLLTGSMTAREKRNAYEKLAVYRNAMVIGTHALIQDRTSFGELALVITDEQHRFGVAQRRTLSEKGGDPHVLVMSATPIPRTLAIILYGDMDISVINEVPASRLPIKNAVVNSAYRPKAYDFIRREVEAGHQAYVICPFVEASETLEGENVVDYAGKLQEELPESIQIGVLHGKMKPAMKDKVMSLFAANEVQVLVSTTVVEVGVNVPNATVMMIENADRFGLAQLHQLRGRVGRGDAQSYCIMVNTSSGKDARRRLDTLARSNDGFFIASEDLKLRGPGDFFGIRQSGDLAFQLADIYQDAAELQAASEAVKLLLEEDPELQQSSHSLLKKQMDLFVEERVKRMNL